MSSQFQFLDYQFNPTTYQATFNYLGADGINFQELISFHKSNHPFNSELLDRALFLAFILIGTSYYKSHPTPTILLNSPLDTFQAQFFSTVYQEGLSQFAFENHLTRSDLAHFSASTDIAPAPLSCPTGGYLVLQSGGKDSLLTATLLQEKHLDFTPFYISSSNHYPSVIDTLGAPFIAKRQIDIPNLQKSAGKNGHVPITYIVKSLALIQAILSGHTTVITSIGQEGNEPSSYINDLPVNHQWSKTWAAEQLFANYVHKYISPGLNIGSLLRPFSELKIAEQFSQKCWQKYGHIFSSCNVANYQQRNDNTHLHWCGNCAKCANSFLLFAPFIGTNDQVQLFGGTDLFAKSELTDTFKGLLGIDNFTKPFECIGEIAELRKAYHLKQSGYADLPFAVPDSDFDYQALGPSQLFAQQLINL